MLKLLRAPNIHGVRFLARSGLLGRGLLLVRVVGAHRRLRGEMATDYMRPRVVAIGEKLAARIC